MTDTLPIQAYTVQELKELIFLLKQTGHDVKIQVNLVLHLNTKDDVTALDDFDPVMQPMEDRTFGGTFFSRKEAQPDAKSKKRKTSDRDANDSLERIDASFKDAMHHGKVEEERDDTSDKRVSNPVLQFINRPERALFQ